MHAGCDAGLDLDLDGFLRYTSPVTGQSCGCPFQLLAWRPEGVVRSGRPRTSWSAPASLEAAMSANCLLDYQIPVPDNRFPRTFSVAYPQNTSGSGPRYTTAPSPLSRASRHRLPASLSPGR